MARRGTRRGDRHQRRHPLGPLREWPCVLAVRRDCVEGTGTNHPPAAAQLEGEGQSQERHQRTEGTGSEEDDGLEYTDAQDAHEVEREETGVANRARPKTGEVETCMH